MLIFLAPPERGKMTNILYKIRDYFKETVEEKLLRKEYKKAEAVNDEDGMKEALRKLKKLRGITSKQTSVENKDGSVRTETVTCFNANVFVQYILSVFTVVKLQDAIAFYNWKEHHYEFLDSETYLRFFKLLLDEFDVYVWNISREKEYLKRFQRDIKRQLKEWQIPKGMVCFTNGILDVVKHVFTPGDNPKIISFASTGYAYDPDAKCDTWLEFLQDVFNKDNERVKVLQQSMGYSFCYSMSYLHAIVILLGKGRNGKSLVGTVLSYLHGVKNCSASSLASIASRFGTAAIYDKVVNISAEEQVEVDTSVLKAISGADLIQIERKFEKPFFVRTYIKLWLLSNELHFTDRSRGWEERLVPLLFENVYVDNPTPGTNEKKRDYALADKLLKEIPGIFNWVYDGLKELEGNNWKLPESQKVTQAREMIMQEANPVLLFANNCIVSLPNVSEKRSDVYKAFKAWAVKNSIDVGNFVSAQRFYPEFENILSERKISPKTKRIKGNDCYADIQII